jgi:hypothetical protein
VAMFLFAMYNVKLSLFAFFSFDFSIICIMAATLWYLDRGNNTT